jgi:hypothetical protein
MGLYERDYMRAPRDERPTWPPRRPQLLPLTWILCILAMLGIARHAYVNLDSLQRLTGMAPMAQPRPAPMEPTPVPERNPFPDDPTWRTGPRAPVERAAVPESRLQTVFKCVRNGVVSYSGSADCTGGKESSMTIDPGPEPAPVARRPAPAPFTTTRVERPGSVTVTTTNVPHADTRRIECDALDQEIIAIDNAAKQPQGPQTQDMLREQRQRARSRQFSLHC